MYKFSHRSGMTLIEIMLAITVLSSIMIVTLEAISGTLAFRKQATDELDLSTQSYLALEVLTRTIKDGWSIDYEEYWNRSRVGTGVEFWVYSGATGFGNYGYNAGAINNTNTNFWSGKYVCAYQSGSVTNACDSNENSFNGEAWGATDTSTKPQRFGQYAANFYTYKTDADGVNGIIGDYDDEDPGLGPVAIPDNGKPKELYLIKRTSSGVERLIIRNFKINDWWVCNDATWVNCRWQLEILKLKGSDEGLDHDSTNSDKSGEYDGIIDTWRCHPDYSCAWPNNLPLGTGSEFVPLLPPTISVLNWQLDVAPIKDGNRSWRERQYSQAQSVRLTVTLWWSNVHKQTLKNGKEKTITLSTLINLDNVWKQ